MNDYLQAKLDHEKKQKARSDRGLLIFICIFFLGYAFFFSSKYFLPKVYRHLEIAEIGCVLDLDDYLLTLDAWDYAKSDKAFEVIFDVTDMSLDRNAKYAAVCREGEEIFTAEIYRCSGNMLIVRVYDVPSRWADVSLTIGVGDKSEKICMDDKSVTNVGSLTDRTDDEYAVYACQSKINGYKSTIAKLEKEQQEKNDDILLAYKKLEALEAKKKNQTKDEKQSTNASIEKLAQAQAELQNELDDLTLQIKELKQKVKMQKAVLVKLEGAENP